MSRTNAAGVYLILFLCLAVGTSVSSPKTFNLPEKILLLTFLWGMVVLFIVGILRPPRVVVDDGGITTHNALWMRCYPWWQINGARYLQSSFAGGTNRWSVTAYTHLMLDTLRGSIVLAHRQKRYYWTYTPPDDAGYWEDLEGLRTTIEGALKFLRTGVIDEPPREEATLAGPDIGI